MSTFGPVPGEWARKERDGEAQQPRMVFVQAVSRAGIVRYITPNDFCGRRPRDKRAGWTKTRRCKVDELSTLLMSWDNEVIARHVAELGMPEADK